MNKKIIGIPGYKHHNGENFGVGTNHIEFCAQFGNPRIIMPWEEFIRVDLLYLPGGLDATPASYGAVPGYKTSNQDVFKQFFFDQRLDTYIENHIPIFGVCLGAQMLAVKFGCTLTQDLKFHEQSSSRWSEAHEVNYVGYKQDAKQFLQKFNVNSHHHQALTQTEGKLHKDIYPIYISDNEDSYITGDGPIVEAFRIHNRPFYGVQWHPEELYDHYSMSVIQNILR